MSQAKFECIEHKISASHIRQYQRATATGTEEGLQLAVKQYKARGTPQDGDVTILACHGNGFAKELYEPVWDALFDYTQRPNASFRIRSIWIMDCANQGDSAVINDGKLGNEPSWHDFSRDYLNLVNTFWREMPRPIVGFGHSMGGSVIMDLALLHPRLMTTVIAIEPSAAASQADATFGGLAGITFRKDQWPSRQAAAKYFSKTPIHGRWDPRTLDLFLDHGLTDAPIAVPADAEQQPVQLKTSRHQEAVSFARASWPKSRDDERLETVEFDRKHHPEAVGMPTDPGSPIYRPELTFLFSQLPRLRPSCLYVYGSESTFSSAKEWNRKGKLATTGTGIGGSGGAADGRVSELEVEGGSHWLPFEQPMVLGDGVGKWIDKEIVLWREAEIEEIKQWEAVPVEERDAVDDDWKFWTGRLLGKKAAGGKPLAKI